MALHITDDTMMLKIDDRVVATARFSKHDAANENGAWIVSTHPARLFTRDQVMTALPGPRPWWCSTPAAAASGCQYWPRGAWLPGSLRRSVPTWRTAWATAR